MDFQVSLTKLELDGICSPCREKLKNYHEYYKFVLENQKTYEKSLGSRLFEVAKEKDQTEFIFIKEEVEEIKEPRVDSPQKEELEDWNDSTPPHGDESDEEKPVAQKRRKFSKGKRSQKPRSYMVALQKQQSDFIATLFDFKCFLCAKEPDLESYRKVVTHYKQEHRKAKTWKCCGKEMTFSIDLIEHVMDHKGTKWNCLPCGSLYKTAVELWTHQNEVHLEPSKIAIQNPVEWLKLHFICDFCGEKFRTRGFIARHLKDVHIRNHTCYICAAKFYNKKVYATHRRTEHSTVLKIPCPLCGVILKNEARHLSAHMKNMHNKQSLICPICGKVCKNDHAMKVHTIMEHKPRKHTCQYCDKKFKVSLRSAAKGGFTEF